MSRGYKLLAEAFIRNKELDDALKATEKIEDETYRKLLYREIQNNAVLEGRLDLYQEMSKKLDSEVRWEDLALLLFANISQGKLSVILDIMNLLPDDETTVKLVNTAIIESAFSGNLELCERLAERRGSPLTRDKFVIIKVAAVRNGWITDAVNAAKSGGFEVTEEDYRIMFVANKDKGHMDYANEAGARAGIELDEISWSSILLAAVRFNRPSAWDIAEKF